MNGDVRKWVLEQRMEDFPDLHYLNNTIHPAPETRWSVGQCGEDEPFVKILWYLRRQSPPPKVKIATISMILGGNFLRGKPTITNPAELPEGLAEALLGKDKELESRKFKKSCQNCQAKMEALSMTSLAGIRWFDLLANSGTTISSSLENTTNI